MQRFGYLKDFLPEIIHKLDTSTLRGLYALPSFLYGQVLLSGNGKEKVLIFQQSIPSIIKRTKYLKLLCEVLHGLWQVHFPKLGVPSYKWQRFQKKLRGWLLSEEYTQSLYLLARHRKEMDAYWLPNAGLISIQIEEIFEKDLECLKEIPVYRYPYSGYIEREGLRVYVRFSLLPKTSLNIPVTEGKENKLAIMLKLSLEAEIMTRVLHSLPVKAASERREAIAHSRTDEICKRLKEKGLINKDGVPMADLDEIIKELWPKGKEICPYCGRPYIPRTKNQYCCGRSTCRSRARRKRLKEKRERGVL